MIQIKDGKYFKPAVLITVVLVECSYNLVAKHGLQVKEKEDQRLLKCDAIRVEILVGPRSEKMWPRQCNLSSARPVMKRLIRSAQIWACKIGAWSGPDMAPSNFVFLQIVQFKGFSFNKNKQLVKKKNYFINSDQ